VCRGLTSLSAREFVNFGTKCHRNSNFVYVQEFYFLPDTKPRARQTNPRDAAHAAPLVFSGSPTSATSLRPKTPFPVVVDPGDRF
jgi:hypothetical protein